MTIANPVWGKDFPDPFVLAWRGRYFAYATETFAHGPGFQCLESPDLAHWTHRGTVFTPPWSKTHLWAPEVFAHGKALWLTYSALNPQTNKHDIALAVGTHPLGPFVPHATLVRGDDNRVGVIDATVFRDGGRLFLIYSEEEPRRIVLRRLRGDGGGVDGPAVELVRPDQPWERGVTEAPTLVKRDGRYHLLYSAGWFQSDRKADASYCVAHAVADRVEGPYAKTGAFLTGDGKTLFGPGHQCVVTVRRQDWLFYHGWDDQAEPRYGSNPNGRTLRVDKLTWKDGLPRIG